MDLNREHLRAMIFYDLKCGLTEQLSLERLQSALEDSAPSRATVFRWFKEFKIGRTNLEDDLRGGRPETAVTAENVWKSEMLVREDPRITYTNIEKILGISSGSVNTILHQHLGVRKLCCRWILRLLSGAEKQARVDWCREMLIRFENRTSRRVSEIVTGDETWIYQYDPESKKQSSVWVFAEGQLPTKLQRPRNVGKKNGS
ncbi:protein GVQW3-like [Hyposmocoma kahamanoa]|uniref:protein GVQW3-like n=1 Tax=Hyposmocoma kahamanoa TaxID=1477025 RepID=UPI000E6D6D6F|nr:protein GVQW3-like [Hyposmocoma kahamanoa]